MAKLLLTKICHFTLMYYIFFFSSDCWSGHRHCYFLMGPCWFWWNYTQNTASPVLSSTEISLQRTMDDKHSGMIVCCPYILILSCLLLFFFSRRWPFTQIDQPSYTCHVQVSASFQQQSQSPLPCCSWAGEWTAVAWENLFPINTRQLGAEEKFTPGLLWMSKRKYK